MKRTLLFTAACLLLITLLFPGCNTPAINREYPITRSMMEDYAFQEGSYWIYQRSSDLVTDSVYITGTITSTFEANPWSERKIEIRTLYNYFRMDWHSTYADQNDYYCLSNNFLRQGGGDREENQNLGVALLKMPVVLHERLSGGGPRSSYINDNLAALTLGGTTYYTVVSLYEEDQAVTDANGNNVVNVYYLAPGIGIIRKETNVHTANPEYWNLIRHQVIQ